MNINELPNNPHISRADLAELHDGAWQWACARLQGDREAADEVMQQVYLMILEGQAKFDQRASLKTWLYGVIRHTCHHHFRKRVRKQAMLTSLAHELTAHSDASSVSPPDDAQHGMSAAMQTAMTMLPARQRDVLELIVYREFSLSECASILGMRVGSVRTHYQRAKVNLRKHLKTSGIDHE